MSGSASLFTSRWIHARDAQEEVLRATRAVLRRYPIVPPLTITLRWPTRKEGCWCYRHGRALDVRPHEHKHELGGCPVEPAGDAYLWLEVKEAA